MYLGYRNCLCYKINSEGVGTALKIKAIFSSETLIPAYKSHRAVSYEPNFERRKMPAMWPKDVVCETNGGRFTFLSLEPFCN
jgi:hypothetical protein